MFETFKAKNSKWNYTTVVMADKDINEREIIKEVLPNASVLICLFHTLRTFRRDGGCACILGVIKPMNSGNN